MVTMPEKSFVTPVNVEIRHQSSIAHEMYSDGRSMRLMNMFDGTCIRIYPTYNPVSDISKQIRALALARKRDIGGFLT